MNGDSSSQSHKAPNVPLADAPPHHASVDQLIAWLARQRDQHPMRPLAELIAHQTLSAELLVELAAVDLIGQRRRGHDALVEHYVDQFERLGNQDSLVLDLIDAELCVRREMNQDCDAEFLIRRFPTLADSIRQLVHLGAGRETPPQRPTHSIPSVRSTPPSGQMTVDLQSDLSDDSDPFLIQRNLTVDAVRHPRLGPQEDHRDDDSIDTPIPIKPPAWMVGARCIATSQRETGRSWLIKGRDTQRNDTVAMKILPLPATLTRTERTRILDLCETTSSVAHPAWVAPRIAAINNGHLAVVRPWIFGRSFAANQRCTDSTQHLMSLARIAFALAAAHRIGATHGSVKAENIIIDHQSNINLIDAVSSAMAWENYLSSWDNDLSQTLGNRIRQDVQELAALIAAVCLASFDRSKLDWTLRVTDSVDFQERDACAKIGENLQTLLDQPPTKRTWWRK
ncbi:MAG: serine/threonine protein kinase [Planctomycetales bacterium]|nr:serine/threonine protein kinase [Planctomycetales bacterium]